ncbi:MAG: transmembrane sensor [Saprospiraceae bacterium]|jgi:transmembrane sensor
MKSDKYIALISKQLEGTLSPKEAKQLREYEKNSADSYDLPFDLDMDSDFVKVSSRLNKSAKTVQMPAVRNSWMRIAAAGAILLVAGFLLRNYFAENNAAWENVTASTEIQELQLADGTKVWLNAGSTLSYPTAFSDTERSVKLEGEAYFEVTHDTKKRFQVLTEQTTVTVLGTAFNVRAEGDENTTEVAVSEGKVQVEEKQTAQKVILSVNEKALYDHVSNKLTETNDADLNELAWQRKKLKFTGTTLQNALSVIEKEYGVSVILENESIANCEVAGNYKTDTNVINLLKNISQATVTEKDGKYILTGGKCNE